MRQVASRELLRPWSALARSLPLSLMLAACQESDDPGGWTIRDGDGGSVMYGEREDVIVSPGSSNQGAQIVSDGDPDDCVRLDPDVCVPLSEAKASECGDVDAQVDVVVLEGQVIAIICYPSPDGGQPVEEVLVSDGSGATALPQNKNGAVVTFGDATAQQPIQGDITLSAERVTLFGRGVDQTILDGSVVVASNGGRLRGLTITGDLSFERNANNASLSFSAVRGGLRVSGNGLVAINTLVFGDVEVSGQSATFINLGVQGEWGVAASTSCAGCYSFADEDGDWRVADAERLDALTCPGPPPSL